MPRTKSTENTEVKKEATKVVKSNKPKESNDDKDVKIKELENQLSEMKELINGLINKQPEINTTNISEEYIPIVSHTVGELTLSTLGYGQGTLYSIPRFGDIIDVPFSDLKNIVMNNRQITENGRFYILNEQAIKQLRLERVYDNLLSNDDVMSLFNMDAKAVIGLYDSCNDKQKEMIADLVRERLYNKEYVNGDVIFHIQESIGTNLITE